MRKNIVIFKCDICGKENKIRKSYLSKEEIQSVQDNEGCFCSKCSLMHKQEKYALCILIGEIFTVYPKVIDIFQYKERQVGRKRAKEILEEGKKS